MPFCPKCKAEFREGYTWCRECQLELLPTLEGLNKAYTAADAERLLVGRELLPVALANITEAERLLEFLLHCGVPALLARDAEHSTPQMPLLAVLVEQGRIKEVRDVLQAQWHGEVVKLFDADEQQSLAVAAVETIDACPACGGHVPPTVAECPECGLTIGAVGEESCAPGSDCGGCGK